MKVKDLCKMPQFTLLTSEIDTEEVITGGYCGDLLSWVMAHAQKGNAWITVQTHVNIIAIATLLELSCIIVPEDIEVDEDTLIKAQQESMPILRSHLNSFEISNLLYEGGIK
ncbi:AraC family transcriptional regulator [Irregularibacter muris]|uniref:AraC family transcriptional regulator n=1 Tax=Irregularibacter muris TaxID=1796619 RepID=A0AAE3L080_9FIRM|nr:AraC family transcriptional regulator [Irregularibacter muris]MCR1899881.1 AraC family transcriptional regulator [Irregularibacter muris]